MFEFNRNKEPLQDGYSIYCDYLFIRNSLFTDSFKVLPASMENWQARACKRTTYDKCKLFMFFEQLSRYIDRSKNIPFLLAQFIECGMSVSIPDIVSNEKHCFGEYYKLIRRVSNLKENYHRDLLRLKELFGKWENLFNMGTGSYYPPIFVSYMNHDITPETFAFLIRLFCMYPVQNVKLSEDPLYLTEVRKIAKYCNFLSVTNKDILEVTPRVLDSIC